VFASSQAAVSASNKPHRVNRTGFMISMILLDVNGRRIGTWAARAECITVWHAGGWKKAAHRPEATSASSPRDAAMTEKGSGHVSAKRVGHFVFLIQQVK
jgi:hypothetical protein